MTIHPIFPEQLEDEDWIDWYQRAFDAVTNEPPAAPAGFVLVPCASTPRHWPTYSLDDGDTEPANCGTCVYNALAETHRPCEHKQHRAWRTWKASRKVAGWLYTLGLLRGFGTTHSRYCNGCLISIHWSLFRGPYVLFVKRETWRCWRAWHRRGDEVGFGYCGKCMPWSCCGSTRRDHTKDCTERDS